MEPADEGIIQDMDANIALTLPLIPSARSCLENMVHRFEPHVALQLLAHLDLPKAPPQIPLLFDLNEPIEEMDAGALLLPVQNDHFPSVQLTERNKEVLGFDGPYLNMCHNYCWALRSMSPLTWRNNFSLLGTPQGMTILMLFSNPPWNYS